MFRVRHNNVKTSSSALGLAIIVRSSLASRFKLDDTGLQRGNFTRSCIACCAGKCRSGGHTLINGGSIGKRAHAR